MSKVFITDTTLRDAHQCLLATRMRTDDMLPICDKMDAVGFWALEVWGGATFDSCLRFLKEDPWQRLRDLREALPNTQLSMLLRGQNLVGYRHYPDDVVRAFIKKSADNGVDVFRIFDALNDMRNLEVSIAEVKKAGKHAQGAVSYTTSPVHDIDQFVAMAKQFEALGCDSIAVKDMAGLLTPVIATELTKRLVAECSVPIHLHSHSTSGLAAICLYEGVKQGARHIDTAISSMAEGASHTCTESMVVALQDTDYDTGLDLTVLQDIGEYFTEVRKKYWQFESESTSIDPRVQIYQVPGGMISNLYNQLKEQNALDRLPEVQQEIPRVRKDLGYPPLVTPSSQIVGTQAVLNVLAGERYKTVTNEVKLYCQGKYGKPPADIDPQVRQKAIGNTEVIDGRPADLLSDELPSFKREIADLATSEEDVLSYALFPDIAKEFLTERAAGTLMPEPLEIAGEQQADKTAPKKFTITMHGESYEIAIRGSGHAMQHKRPYYLSVDGMPEEVVVEVLDQVAVGQTVTGDVASSRPRASEPGHVTVSMPSTVVEVKVKTGDQVKAGDGLLITEAMKMETEIQAPVTGLVANVHCQKGDKVNPDEILIEIN